MKLNDKALLVQLKVSQMTGRKYEVRYKKTKDLDADIQKQKDMIMGKFNG